MGGENIAGGTGKKRHRDEKERPFESVGDCESHTSKGAEAVRLRSQKRRFGRKDKRRKGRRDR